MFSVNVYERFKVCIQILFFFFYIWISSCSRTICFSKQQNLFFLHWIFCSSSAQWLCICGLSPSSLCCFIDPCVCSFPTTCHPKDCSLAVSPAGRQPVLWLFSPPQCYLAILGLLPLLINFVSKCHSDWDCPVVRNWYCGNIESSYNILTMTNLDSILKSRDITLPKKVRLVKAVVFPVVMYGCESWTIKKAECRKIDAFELWCWRRVLRVWCEELIHWKTPWCWERLKAGGEGDNRGWMVGWHHWLNGHDFEQAPEDGIGHGSLVCCSPWGRKAGHN